jgi:MscS family membrane protein
MHYLQQLKDLLNYDFFRYEIYHNSSFDWLVSLLIIIASVALSRLVFWLLSKILKTVTVRSKTHLDDLIVDICRKPVILAIILGGVWWALQRLSLPLKLDHVLGIIYKVAVALNITWFVARLAKGLLEQYFILLSRKGKAHKGKIDIHIVSIVRKMLVGVIWVFGIIAALNSAGINVSALLAGLGIGGIAFALAAQDTVKNIFGGITIFTDSPFRIGDLVDIGGMTGTVEDIGLRSIRLRTLNGRLITIPNYKTVDSNLENITQEPARRIELKINLTYDTTPEKMELALQILRDTPNSIPDIEEKTDVFFATYGDFALGITYYYFIKKDSSIFQTQSDVNLHILREFNKNKLDFAFPTQTILVNKN